MLGLAVFLRYKQNHLKEAMVEINGDRIVAEVAGSQSAREKGLSGRTEMPPGRGMLFVFPTSGRHPFWMKGMNFAIDIIWINGNKIVDIAPGAAPPIAGSDPQVLIPREEADFVLEIASGGAALRRWKIGDEIKIDRD